MKPRNRTLKQLTLIIGILVAIVAGLNTTVYAHTSGEKVEPGSSIEHQEIVELLEYLWHQDNDLVEPVVTIYDYDFQLLYQGTIKELEQPQLLIEGDLLMTDQNHTIYIVQTSN